MCHWVLHLLQTYSSYNKGRRSVQTAASLRQDAVGESYRYTAIMLLLCIICQPLLQPLVLLCKPSYTGRGLNCHCTSTVLVAGFHLCCGLYLGQMLPDCMWDGVPACCMWCKTSACAHVGLHFCLCASPNGACRRKPCLTNADVMAASACNVCRC